MLKKKKQKSRISRYIVKEQIKLSSCINSHLAINSIILVQFLDTIIVSNNFLFHPQMRANNFTTRWFVQNETISRPRLIVVSFSTFPFEVSRRKVRFNENPEADQRKANTLVDHCTHITDHTLLFVQPRFLSFAADIHSLTLLVLFATLCQPRRETKKESNGGSWRSFAMRNDIGNRRRWEKKRKKEKKKNAAARVFIVATTTFFFPTVWKFSLRSRQNGFVNQSCVPLRLHVLLDRVWR